MQADSLSGALCLVQHCQQQQPCLSLTRERLLVLLLITNDVMWPIGAALCSSRNYLVKSKQNRPSHPFSRVAPNSWHILLFVNIQWKTFHKLTIKIWSEGWILCDSDLVGKFQNSDLYSIKSQKIRSWPNEEDNGGVKYVIVNRHVLLWSFTHDVCKNLKKEMIFYEKKTLVSVPVNIVNFNLCHTHFCTKLHLAWLVEALL